MKKNKLLWIVLPAAAVLIAAICVTAFILISNEKKDDKYRTQMQAAEQYLMEGDYDKLIAAYQAAIDLKPEDVDAYVGLAEAYMENGQYVEASETARLGFAATRSSKLEALLAEITDRRFTRGSDDDTENVDGDASGSEGKLTEKTTGELMLRYSSLSMISDACYQEFLDNYGSSTVSYDSEGGFCKVKFASLDGYAYFKNTSAYSNAVDTIKKIPNANARPYKFAISSPSLIFLKYDGYASFSQICDLIGSTGKVVYDEENSMYKLSLRWGGSTIIFETDQNGNLCKKNPLIEIYPDELIKADWVEEAEEETEEETTDDTTFTLGGETFSYDVETIYLYGVNIGSLEPLRKCQKLKYLELYNCWIDGLEPLADCAQLVEVDLDGTTGFSDLTPLDGLSNLKFLCMHECVDVSDISPIMNHEFDILHVCGTQVSYEQAIQYKQKYMNCSVWYDYHTIGD